MNESLKRLWKTAEDREDAGDPVGAAESYREVLESFLKSDAPFEPLLQDRLGRALARLGEYRSAILVFAAFEKQLDLEQNAFGLALIRLRMAQVCVQACEVNAAESFLAEIADKAGTWGATLLQKPKDLMRRVVDADWAAVTDEQSELIRAEGLRTLAQVWAVRGVFEPAIAACRAAIPHAQRVPDMVSPAELELFRAELQLDQGSPNDVLLPRKMLTDDAPDLSEPDVTVRWQIIAARRDWMLGHLEKAIERLEKLADREKGIRSPAVRTSVVLSLAGYLALVNRVGEAERLLLAELGRMQPKSLVPRARLNAALELTRARRRAASREILLPFAPQHVLDDAIEIPMSAERMIPQATSAATLGVPTTRRLSRFADEWALRVNIVLAAIASGDLRAAEQTLSVIQALVEKTDSPRIRVRTQFLRAMVAHHRGDYRRAAEILQPTLNGADPLLPLDEWESQRLAAWIAARAGERDRFEEHSARAKVLLDDLAGAMSSSNRVFFLLNKWTAQDEYLATRLSAALRLQAAPCEGPPWSRWLSRRRQRRLALSVFREANALVGWNVESQTNPTTLPVSDRRHVQERPSDVQTGNDVERIVGRQLTLRASRRNPGAWHRLVPWILHRLPKRGAVLQFYVLPDRIAVFVLSRGRIRIHELAVTRIELDEAVRGALHAVMGVRTASASGYAKATTECDDRLNRVASLLRIEESLGLLPEDIDGLVIVPHDALINVPFSALPFHTGRLCDRYAISYVPQLAFLKPRATAQDRPLKLKRFSCIAVARYPWKTSEWSNLPGVIKEIRAVWKVIPLPERRKTLLLQQGATRARILMALERGGWAHIACHGEFRAAAPHESSLLVKGEGGRLDQVSIADLSTRSFSKLELAVVAICWSLSTAYLPGGESVCIPASFLYGGTRSVVASLWEVDDELNAQFVEEFYRRAVKVAPARALAEVQREWARKDRERARWIATWGTYMVYGAR